MGRIELYLRFGAAEAAPAIPGVLPRLEMEKRSAVGYITPNDMLAGRQKEIHDERDRKLEAARQERQRGRQQAA